MTLQPEQARRLVRDSYDRLGRRYADWAHANNDPVRERYIQFILTALPNGSEVLDLGCGDGSQVTARLAERFQVTGVDISSVQIESARRSIFGARFVCKDLVTLALPGESFDGVASFYCMTHLPPPDLPVVLGRIATWLRPGGLFAGSFGVSDDPGSVDENWLAVPMYFSGSEPETNRQMLTAAGLEIEQESIETVQESGQPVSFHWIVARKPSG